MVITTALQTPEKHPFQRAHNTFVLKKERGARSKEEKKRGRGRERESALEIDKQ